MRIGVLTSGGDAPGMNAFLVNLYYLFKNANHEIIFFCDGFLGLYEKRIFNPENQNLSNYANLAGSFLGSARFEAFKEISIKKKAVTNLRELKVDKLVVVGGDGSHKGAESLNSLGVSTFFVPATIDNDLSYESYSLGFDSALNEIIESIYKIKQTFQASKNICFLEIMGRDCIDLTLSAARATLIDLILPDKNLNTEDKIVDLIAEKYQKNKFVLILVKELFCSPKQKESLMKKLELTLKRCIRWNVIGYVQRGAQPSGFDLNYAFLAAEYLLNNIHEDKLEIHYNGWTISSTNQTKIYQKNDETIALINSLKK